MPTRETARTEILERIQRANGAARGIEEAAAAWAQIPRTYDAAPQPQETVVSLLIDRLRDYDAEVERVASSAIADRVQFILEAKAVTRVLLPVGVETKMTDRLESAHIDHAFTASELDTFACVITEATLGIAETGTLILQNVPGQGRRAASLVPDFHICILRASDVVASVPEAIRRLQATCTLPTTFISGPSATADIEMTRIKGVHGPRFLHVLIAE